jgi:hypothetical protein
MTKAVSAGVFASLLAPQLLSAQAQPDAGNLRSAAIHVQVVDYFGRPLTSATITLAASAPNPSAGRFTATGVDMLGVPFGDYVLKVSVPGFKAYSERVDVDRDGIWLSAAMEASMIDTSTSDPVLTGEIRPHPNGHGRVWAGLLGIYNSVRVEAPVSEGGLFHLDPRVDGIYVLVILNDDTVLDTRKVSVFGYTKIMIESEKTP